MTSQSEKYAESGRYKDSLIWFMLFILSEGPLHGYDIIKRIKELTMNQWKPAAGSIYPLLNYMKEQGLIEVASVEEGVRGGKKIVYRLTDKGWAEFRSLLIRKANMYMSFISRIMCRSIIALRENGYKSDADQLCNTLRQWLENSMNALPSVCSNESRC